MPDPDADPRPPDRGAELLRATLLPDGLDPDDVVEAVEIVPDDRGDADDPDGADDPNAGRSTPRASGFDGVGTRRESRERALALLYEAEQRGATPPAAVLDLLPVPAEAYAVELVTGVSDHLDEIDDRIRRYSVSWPLERMPAVDRALLRLGSYELAHTDVPTGACISEAVELAKRYSTDDSHRFVNGMLARIADEVRST